MNLKPDSKQLPVRAVTMTLFPTLESLQQAVEFAESKLPILHKNDLTAILMTFQNTLLASLKKDNLIE